MKTNKVVSVIVLTAFGMVLLSCAASSGKKPNLSGDEVQQSSTDGDREPGLKPASAFNPAAQCTAESGDYLACSSQEECCKGYSCGFDPEGSHVQRYCLPE